MTRSTPLGPAVRGICVLAILGWLGAIGLFTGPPYAASDSVRTAGTEAASAGAELDRRFGHQAAHIVLLEAPAAVLDRSGPGLTRSLRVAGVGSVAGPWDAGGATAALRASPTAAAVLVSTPARDPQAGIRAGRAIERAVAERAPPSVRVTVTGTGRFSEAFQESGDPISLRFVLLSALCLLLAGLALWRSAPAALIPPAVGLLAHLAGRGGLHLAGRGADLEPTAASGLALGAMAMAALVGASLVHAWRRATAGVGWPRRVPPAELALGCMAPVCLALAALGDRSATGFAAGLGVATVAAALAGYGLSGLLRATGARVNPLPRRPRWARKGTSPHLVPPAYLHFEARVAVVVGLAGAVSSAPWLFDRVSPWVAVLLVAVAAIVIRARSALEAVQAMDPPREDLERALRFRLYAWPAFTLVFAAIPPAQVWPTFVINAALLLYGLDVSLRRTWMTVASDGDPNADSVHRMAATRGARVALAGGTALALIALVAAGPLLRTGPLDPRLLPSSEPAVTALDRVADKLGGGWVTPFDVLVERRGRPLTTKGDLAALVRVERRIRRLDGVTFAAGAGVVAEQAAPLAAAAEDFERTGPDLEEGADGLGELRQGLEEAEAGVGAVRGGLREAAAGADALRAGGGEARDGGREVADGLRDARGGSRQLAGGLGDARGGADELATGSGAAATGAVALRDGLREAEKPVRTELAPGIRELASGLREGAAQLPQLGAPVGLAVEDLREALRGLRAMPQAARDANYEATVLRVREALQAVTGTDPESGAAFAPGYRGLATEITDAARGLGEAGTGAGQLAAGAGELSTALGRLRQGADELVDGLGALESGNRQLVAGLGSLQTGQGELGTGLGQLVEGSDELTSGAAELAAGAGQLGDGLREGDVQAAPLEDGLQSSIDPVREFERALRASSRDAAELLRDAPGLYRSGHFTLAALDGAPPATRRSIADVLALDDGGRASRITVVPDTADPEALRALAGALRRVTHDEAQRTGLRIRLTGPAAEVLDLHAQAAGRGPWLVLLCASGLLAVMAVGLGIARAAIVLALGSSCLAAGLGAASLLVPDTAFDVQVDGATLTVVSLVALGLSCAHLAHLAADRAGGLLAATTGRAGTTPGRGLALAAATAPFAIPEVTFLPYVAFTVAAAALVAACALRPLAWGAIAGVLDVRSHRAPRWMVR